MLQQYPMENNFVTNEHKSQMAITLLGEKFIPKDVFL